MNSGQFLQHVTSFIRSREAKQHVEVELNQHLQQAKRAWMKKGYTEQEAEQCAVEAMGSATTLGQSLQKIYKPKVDWVLIGLLSMLFLLSFLPLLALNNQDYPMFAGYRFIMRNGLHIMLSVAVICVLMFVDVRKLEHFGYAFYGLGVTLLAALVWMPTTWVNGEAMLLMGSFRVSVWFIFPIFCFAWATLFSRTTMKLWQALSLIAIALFLAANIANLAALFLFYMLTLTQLFFGQWTKREKLFVLGIMVVIPLVSAFYLIIAQVTGEMRPYQISRLQGYWYPNVYADSSGYMYILLKEVIVNAHWFGASGGRVIPEAHTDFVLAFIIQSYGFGVALLVLLLLLAMIIRIGRLVVSKPSSFAKLLVIGVCTLLSTQIIYAILMTFGIVPIIAIPLPFMSYGFTPVVLNAFLIGFVLSVYRRKSFIFAPSPV